jgi:hypothetical protein
MTNGSEPSKPLPKAGFRTTRKEPPEVRPTLWLIELSRPGHKCSTHQTQSNRMADSALDRDTLLIHDRALIHPMQHPSSHADPLIVKSGQGSG